ncbi:hypothetical protein ACFOWE_25855, partial [Planomonospora corallina]
PYGPAAGTAGGRQAHGHLTSPGLKDFAHTRPPSARPGPGGPPAPLAPDGGSNGRVFAAVAAAFVILLLAGAGLMYLESFS